MLNTEVTEGAPISAMTPPNETKNIDELSKRNLWCYSLGGIGRDMMYQLFNTFMLTCIMLTKGVNQKQFAIVGVIIICCRIFDALNDPIMGTIIEHTRTKWGKFKPWVLIGAISNSLLVCLIFWVPLQGNAFIIFFAVAYVFWSITFTMNDISYWSMMPSLTQNPNDRNRLSALANLCAGIGAGIAVVLIPALTVGKFTIGGNAPTAYIVIAVIISVVFIGCQTMTCICVKEKPLPPKPMTEGGALKKMIKIIFSNDQLKWIAVVMVIYGLGSSVIGGLSTYFVYFRFGYEGAMVSLFGILTGISGGVMIFYPMLARRFTRKTILKISMALIVLGYGLMLIMGLTVDNFYVIALCGLFYSIGQSVFYMILTLSIANIVEYNEYKTGRREEGIIFSIRPFTAKMGSALQMGVVTLILSILRIADTTNQISTEENAALQKTITETVKLERIKAIIDTVPDKTINWLLVCMTVIPVILVGIAAFIWFKKYNIDEKRYVELVTAIAERKQQETAEQTAMGNDVSDSAEQNVIESNDVFDSKEQVEQPASDSPIAEDE